MDATVDDLMRVKGRAELIGGVIHKYPPVGFAISMITGNLLFSLNEYADAVGRGHAYSTSLAYIIPRLPSGRESFCATVSYYDGPLPEDRDDPISGPPTFAVEVRTEWQPAHVHEAARRAKRADYFQAGTLVVWDIDPETRTIACYSADAPDTPRMFGRGDVADAAPACPGWTIAATDVFDLS